VKRQVLNCVQEVAFECHTEAHLPTADVAQAYEFSRKRGASASYWTDFLIKWSS